MKITYNFVRLELEHYCPNTKRIVLIFNRRIDNGPIVECKQPVCSVDFAGDYLIDLCDLNRPIELTFVQLLNTLSKVIYQPAHKTSLNVAKIINRLVGEFNQNNDDIITLEPLRTKTSCGN